MFLKGIISCDKSADDFLRLIEEYIISLDPPTPTPTPHPSLRPIELQPREPYPKGPKPREP